MNTPQFYIIKYDRPHERLIAERRSDGKFYYIHPSLRDDQAYWGMPPSRPTPLSEFGITVDIKGGILRGMRTGHSTAAHVDGRPRRWQGSTHFHFAYQSEEPPMTPTKSDEGWRVHAIGPDDIYPCETEIEALRQANQINQESVRGKEHYKEDWPFLIAIVLAPGEEPQ